MQARQEVLNAELARQLEQEGLIAFPEPRTAQGKLPDVLLALGGLHLMLEAEVDDQPDAAEKAYRKASERIEQGLCHLALALVYPAHLRSLSLSQLSHALRTAPLRFALLRPPLPETPSWRTGDLQALADALRHAYELLVAEDEVQRAVEQLKQGIGILAGAFYTMQVHEARLAEPLGISPNAIDPNKNEQTAAVRQIAALVLMNALLFHEELARTEPRVPTLSQCFEGMVETPRFARGDKESARSVGVLADESRPRDADATGKPHSPHEALLAVWQYILQTINYHAVFDLARRILLKQSAVHLTAATLAMPIPEVMVWGMRLYTMPLGILDGVPRLGSLDLLSGAPATPQLSLYPELGQTAQRATATRHQPEALRLPPLDLVCMNPPFTRTCGDNLLFGSLTGQERTRLQQALQELLKQHGAEAHITAGLGAVFMAVADRHLKAGGRLAFVLPKALLSGVAWQPSRELIARAYQLEYLIVSHDPDRWNFSENTDLSEVLLVARKSPSSPDSDSPMESMRQHPSPSGRGAGGEGDPPLPPRGSGAGGEGTTLRLNLWRNPDNPVDALLLSHEVRKLQPSGERVEVFDLWMGDEKWGEAVAVPTAQLYALPHWLLPCAFAQSELTETLLSLMTEGRLGNATLPLAPLGKLGELGPDRRDIYDGFEVLTASSTPTSYPALWGHDAEKVTTIQHAPNTYLTPLRQARKRRPLRNAQLLWSRAGELLLAERMWLNTQRLLALYMGQPVLSNVWWSARLHNELSGAHAKSLVLWLNSTLGLLIVFGNRQETRGAWVSFKKPIWQAMPVLDVRALSERQVDALAQAFDQLAGQALQPLSQMDADPVRAQIDEAIARALGLGDLSSLRAALAREPVVRLKGLRQRRR